MAQFATVAAITGNGTVFAVNEQGVSRVLKPGDIVEKGETVRTVGNAQVELLLEDGNLLAVEPQQTMRLDENIAQSDQLPTAQDSAIATPGTAEAVIQALERGTDLSEALEAAAAGLGGAGAADGGNSFVQLLRIVEPIDPLAYDYSFTAADVPPTLEAVAATLPPATEPPATEPPATLPPATEPPATLPPATDPPATEPPVTLPPATEPPATLPPATEPPVITHVGGLTADIDSVTVPEGTPAVFTVNLSMAPVVATEFALNLASGTGDAATLGADFTSAMVFGTGATYNSVTGMVTVAAGVSSFTVTVPTVLDGMDEPSPENFSLTVGGVTGAGYITDIDLPSPVVSTTSVDETALDINKGVGDLASGTSVGTSPASDRETTTGTVTGLPSGWTVVPVITPANTSYGKFTIDANGAYVYTLVNAPHNALGGASATDTVTYQMYNASTNESQTNQLIVTVYDDGPVVSDTNGLIKNAIGQTLADVIEYNLGADGLGSVLLSYNGSALTSHGKAVVFALEDTNGDGLKELVGRIDLDGSSSNGQEHTVLTLAPNSSSGAEGAYSLNLLDVLDQTAPVRTVRFDGITASGPVDDLTVGTTGLHIYAVNPGPDDVNASANYVGINSNVMNGAESIGYHFTAGMVNDVSLITKDTGSGIDKFTWRTSTDGLIWTNHGEVSLADGATSSVALHATTGYNYLELTVTKGDFKVGGLTYSDVGDPQDLTLTFGYRATDGDGDAVSGSFNATVNASQTELTLGSALETFHPDHLIKPDPSI